MRVWHSYSTHGRDERHIFRRDSAEPGVDLTGLEFRELRAFPSELDQEPQAASSAALSSALSFSPTAAMFSSR